MCEMSTWKHCPFHHRIQKLHLRLSFIKPPLHTTSFNPHNPAQAGEATWPRFTDEGSRWRGKSSSSELQALSLHHGNCVCLPPTFFPCFYVCKPNNILIWKNDYQHPLPSLSYHMTFLLCIMRRQRETESESEREREAGGGGGGRRKGIEREQVSFLVYSYKDTNLLDQAPPL